MEEKIKELQSIMYRVIEKYGISSKEALKISQELDVLIVEKQLQLCMALK